MLPIRPHFELGKIGVGKRTLFSTDSFCRGGLAQKREDNPNKYYLQSELENTLLAKIGFIEHFTPQIGFFSLSPKNLHDKKLIALREELYG